MNVRIVDLRGTFLCEHTHQMTWVTVVCNKSYLKSFLWKFQQESNTLFDSKVR